MFLFSAFGVAPVVHAVRAFCLHAEGVPAATNLSREFKTGCDSSTVKRTAISMSVTGPRRWPLYDIRCGTLKNSHCSMTLSADHTSKLAAPHRQWYLDGSIWVKNSHLGRKTTNNQTVWLLFYVTLRNILRILRRHIPMKG